MIEYIPIATTLFSIFFAIGMYRHLSEKKNALYLLWWLLGVVFYGAGTFVESWVTLFGWNEVVFKSWYIFGALLGGAPLAQGTVYLLMKRKTAHTLTVALVAVVLVTSGLVIASPILHDKVEADHLTGAVLEWQFIRGITPFINIYAFIFLVGGAVYSALQYRKRPEFKSRFLGNVYIAIGGLLPGIGGSFTKFGFTEVLYVTEFIGLLFIYFGYKTIRLDKSSSIHKNQVAQ